MNLELKNKLMNLKSQALVLDLKNLVGEERKLKARILHYLWVIQCKRIFAEFGYPSLFEFCIKHLGYTEAETQRRISAMKLLGELPQIEEKITEGKLSLSALAMAQSLFRQEAKNENSFSKEQKIEVLEVLENKSVRECEKELLKFSSQLILPRERVRSITENTVEVKFNAPNEFIEKLEKLKALRSHKTGGASTYETISNLVDEALKEAQKEKLGCKKVVEKKAAGEMGLDARRSVSVAQQVALNLTSDIGRDINQEIKKDVRRNIEGDSSLSISQHREGDTKRDLGQDNMQKSNQTINQSISEKIKENINQRITKSLSRNICQNIWRKHNAKCAYVDPHTNKKSESEYFLEIEHIKPRALGGDNLPENLKLYCRAHNQLAAIQQLGFKKMNRFINKSKNQGEEPKQFT
jgi:hypothetical protein